MLSHESPVHGVPSGKVLGVNEEDELDALRQTIADLPGDLEDYRQLFLHVARVALRQEQSIPFAPQLEARLHEAFDSWVEETCGLGMAGAVPDGEVMRTVAQPSLRHWLTNLLRGPVAAFLLSVSMSTTPGLRAANESPPDAPRRSASGRFLAAPDSCASSQESLDDITAALEGYELRTAEAVCEYLRDAPDLVSVLEELPGQARQRFGADTSLALEVCPDREGDGPPLLYAHVITLGSADEAWDHLLSLEQGWWLGATEDMPVNLHVEFA